VTDSDDRSAADVRVRSGHGIGAAALLCPAAGMDTGRRAVACRGVYFALSQTQEREILAVSGDDAVMEVIEAIEEKWDEPFLAEMDKGWDAIHRCLTDGRCETDNGTYPLSHAVLGGRQLHEGDDYIVSYVTAEQVRDIAVALQPLDEPWLRERYFALDPSDYGPEHGEDDCAYTWAYFTEMRDLFERAAGNGRPVIFTVDQ
jgi:hypothetical protein